MLSIIIPTKNEEKLLPLLLDSIQRQSLRVDYEIIVADAGSSDRTREIAARFGCKIIEGGLPSEGRNKGAAAARGDLLLFLDADVVIKWNLSDALDEFEEQRGLDVASCRMELDTKTKMINTLVDIGYNIPICVLEDIVANGADFMLSRRWVHERIGGFDEEVRISEDHDYLRRGSKVGKFGILRSVIARTSPRRYEQDGWLRVCAKFALCGLQMAFLGPVKSDIFAYRFDPYREEKRVYKTPWSYNKWPTLFFALPFVAIGLFVWYMIIAFLFVWLTIIKRAR